MIDNRIELSPRTNCHVGGCTNQVSGYWFVAGGMINASTLCDDHIVIHNGPTYFKNKEMAELWLIKSML